MEFVMESNTNAYRYAYFHIDKQDSWEKFLGGYANGWTFFETLVLFVVFLQAILLWFFFLGSYISIEKIAEWPMQKLFLYVLKTA